MSQGALSAVIEPWNGVPPRVDSATTQPLRRARTRSFQGPRSRRDIFGLAAPLTFTASFAGERNALDLPGSRDESPLTFGRDDPAPNPPSGIDSPADYRSGSLPGVLLTIPGGTRVRLRLGSRLEFRLANPSYDKDRIRSRGRCLAMVPALTRIDGRVPSSTARIQPTGVNEVAGSLSAAFLRNRSRISLLSMTEDTK